MPDHAAFAHFVVARHEDGSPVELGRGAMGVTYRATDIQLGRTVALKVINAALLGDARIRQRFIGEARAAARIQHPNVAAIFQLQAEGEEIFFAMEFVPGGTLAQYVQRRGPLPPRLALQIAQQTGQGLAAAHAGGVLHRDIKPANLMLARELAPDDESPLLVKVIDFGLARNLGAGEASGLTGGAVVGTPSFLSPEQIALDGGRELDGRSDVYSLGVTLWYLLTGDVPFHGSEFQVFSQHLEKAPPFADLAARGVPGEVIGLLQRMLAKDPEERPASCADLLADIARLLHSPSTAAPEAGENEVTAIMGIAPASPRASKNETTTILSPAPAAPPILASTRRQWRRSDGVKAWLFLLLLVAAACWLWPRATPPDKSLAVLPFANLSGERDSQYFVDGVHEDVLNALAKVRDLKVISRTSVLAFRDPAQRNLREIAENLAVGHVLEGTVQRAAGKARINVRLIEARTDRQLWSAAFDRELADVFAVQSEVAREITSALRATFTTSEKSLIARRPTQDREAYDLFLRGRALEQGLTSLSQRAEYEAAIASYAAAAAQDPEFALPQTRLASLHAQMYWFGGIDPSPERRELALGALAAALRLAPEAPETRLAEGAVAYLCEGDWERSIRLYRAAENDLPNDAELQSLIGVSYRRQGRWSEALACFERSQTLSPLHAGNAASLLETLHGLRRFRETAARVERVLRLFPRIEYLQRFKLRTQLALDRDFAAFRQALAARPPGVDDPAGLRRDYALGLFSDLALLEKVVRDPRYSPSQPGGGPSQPAVLSLAEVARLRGEREAAANLAHEALVFFSRRPWPPRLQAGVRVRLAQAHLLEGSGEEIHARDLHSGLAEVMSQDDVVGRILLLEAARTLMCVGRREEALGLVERYLQGPAVGLCPEELLHDSFLTGLRGDPRFEELVRTAKAF